MVLTTRYFPKRRHANVLTALPDMVRFLTNEHSSLTGPGWSIVEAFSSASTSREVPSNSASLNSLTTATSWSAGTLTVGDWIVLESADANNTNHFQLYMEAESAAVIGLLLIPLENFATGGSAVTPPTFPTASVGVTGSLPLGITGSTAYAYYSIVADQGMMSFLYDTGIDSDVRWTYVGELNGAKGAGSPSDDRAYVVYEDVTSVGWDRNTSTALRVWNRLSPFDDTTILNSGAAAYICAGGATSPIHTNNRERDMLLGVDSILPVGIYFGAGLHRHFAGFLRNVFSVNHGLGSAGMINDRTFIFRNFDASSTTIAGICMRWDGSTLFP